MGKNMRYYKRSHVHYSKSAMKIIALVFMLVGVTFLAVGIGFAIHQTQLKNRCTLEVNAIISDILSKDERHENDDGHVSYSTVYTPVYSYNVDGHIIVLIHIKKKQKSGKNFAENELYEENNYPYDE